MRRRQKDVQDAFDREAEKILISGLNESKIRLALREYMVAELSSGRIGFDDVMFRFVNSEWSQCKSRLGRENKILIGRKNRAVLVDRATPDDRQAVVDRLQSKSTGMLKSLMRIARRYGHDEVADQAEEALHASSIAAEQDAPAIA